MPHLRFFSVLTLTAFIGLACYAQTDTASENSGSSSEAGKPEKKQAINFEDELIEGTAQKPDLFYMFQKNNFKFKKLIKLRENFLPEMNKNAEDIQRLRGGR